MVRNVANHCLLTDIHTSLFLLGSIYLLYYDFQQNYCQHSISILAMNKDNQDIALTTILDYPYLSLTPKHYANNNFAGNHSR